jgi:hypothetical protein
VTDDSHFLSRWSRRKHAARKGEAPAEAVADSPPPGRVPASPGMQRSGPAAEAVEPPPPVESLTPESDFAPFMRKDVDPGLRRQALKALFRDPRHNVMDGLDVYIDDYSKPDPIPPEWLGKLNQMAHFGDHHATEARLRAEKDADASQSPAEVVASNQEVEGPPGGPDAESCVTPPPPSESKDS